MSKKIALTVNGSRFDIDVDEQFAPFLLEQMGLDFNTEGNNDLKVLLQAYVRKNYALYEQQREMQRLLGMMEASEKKKE
jgi:hypothetical protein